MKPKLILHLALAASLPSIVPAQTDNPMADGGNAPTGYDMAPETTLAVVNAAVAMIPTQLPPGPFQPTWDPLQGKLQGAAVVY